MALELLHVPPGGQEHPQHGAVLSGEGAVLAGGEVARRFGAAGVAAQAGQSQALAAHGAVTRRVAGGVHGSAKTCTAPMPTRTESSPSPPPMVASWPPPSSHSVAPAPAAMGMSTRPTSARDLILTLEPRSRATRTLPASHSIFDSPRSRTPLTATLPAATEMSRGEAAPSTRTDPAAPWARMGARTPLTASDPAC